MKITKKADFLVCLLFRNEVTLDLRHRFLR